MWRRLRIIPFDRPVPVTNRDRELGGKLQTPEERSGILAWAVRGCLTWQREGLCLPQCVLTAGEEYRKAEDRIGLFLEERTEVGKEFRVTAGEIYQKYRIWSELRNERPLSQTSFGPRMEQKGFEKSKSHNPRCYLGLRIREKKTL